MNKRLKKHLGIFLASVFTYNIVIVLKIHTMAQPVTMVMQQIPRVLMTAGACILGIATSIWHPQESYIPTTHTIQTPSTTIKEIPRQYSPALLPSVTTDLKPHIKQAAVRVRQSDPE